MAFRNKTTTGINNAFSTISKVSSIYSLSSFAFLAQAKSFISTKLISWKTVMKFNNIYKISNFIEWDSSLFICFSGCSFWHIWTNQIHWRFWIKGWWCVRCHFNRFYFYCTVFKLVVDHEIIRTKDSACCTIWSGATLQFCERSTNSLWFKNLFESVFISKLAVRVVDRVFMIFPSYFCKMFWFSSILFHVLFTCICK